jgi:hypothetical protein
MYHMRQIDKRYLREFLPAMAAYVIVMLMIWPKVDSVDIPVLKIAAALAPMLPLAFAAWAFIRRVVASDELEKQMHLMALSIAVCVVGMACMALGFLASAKILSFPGSLFTWVLPALIGVYGVAMWLTSRRYGNPGFP